MRAKLDTPQFSATAVFHIACVSVQCPACGELLGNAGNGSHLWAITDPMPKVRQCLCGVRLYITPPAFLPMDH